jgi:AraC-like DNA-binding protein
MGKKLTKSLADRKFSQDARLDLMTEEVMRELYEALSLDEIADLAQISRSSVKRLMDDYGIRRRTGGVHAPQSHMKTIYVAKYDGRPLRYRPVADRRRVELSTWRLHILAARCPWTCPYHANDECDRLEDADLDDCKLEQFLAAHGELDRRPWEPEDYQDQILERLGRKFTKSLEAEEDA